MQDQNSNLSINTMKTYNEVIYAVKKNEEGKLQLVTIPLQLDHEPTDYELRQMHNYATDLSYQYCSKLPRISINSYMYNSYERELAIAFEYTIKRLLEDPQIIAYSHRRGGWKTFNWKYNEDIEFDVFSNFGYGSCSCLQTKFFYKGLSLTPYSHYTKYRYADYSQITRYTYDYELRYDIWMQLMTDTIEFYNAIVEQKDEKIFNWLKIQLDRMMCDLEKIQIWRETDRIYGNHEYWMVEGDELVRVKAEKIGGAVDFIENIKKLPVQINPANYIERLSNVLSEFETYANQKLEELDHSIQNLKNSIDQIDAIHNVRIYDRIRKRNYYEKEWNKSDNKFSMFRYLLQLRNRLNISSTKEDLLATLTLTEKKIEERSKLQSELYQKESLRNYLNEQKEKVSQQLQKQVRRAS